ncbi:MAG: glycoside hydrolase family 20 zincin-like fold domain-containing protein [Opitutaceae bacterium]|nr:glycoside hydrolase family 20 zincin-like fold domain-containing protein [Opitutaceae bacterium]
MPLKLYADNLSQARDPITADGEAENEFPSPQVQIAVKTIMHESTQPANPTGASRRAFLKTSATAISAAAVGQLATGVNTRAAEPAPVAPTAAPVLPRTVHPYPNKVTWGAGTFSLGRRVTLTVGSDVNPDVIEMMKETWRQFTLGAVTLEVTRDVRQSGSQFALAPANQSFNEPPKREPKATYALSVDASGAAATATDATGVRHAWFTLLQLLQAENSVNGGLGFTLAHVEIQDWPALQFRGLHLCVFPETTPLMIEKAIRLAAFFKFTHVVLEFWGMLRLEALKELAWPQAWNKEQAGGLVKIARGMGLEVVPMFNGWGHATGSRIRHGRHVVLDQNPQLAALFEPDGWTWCLTNPRAQAIIRSVCNELIEFAGPGKFFHMGCDEAYSHATCDRCRQTDRVQLFADHINQLAGHLEKRGRRAIMWGDPLLERAKWSSDYRANGTPSLPTHETIGRISRRIVIADWQYNIPKGDIATLAHFRKHGFETLGCSWNVLGNIRTQAKAITANTSLGLLMTTWHHLAQSIPTLAFVAAAAWSENQAALDMKQASNDLSLTATATLLRKLVPAGGKFESAGWNSFEMPVHVF